MVWLAVAAITGWALAASSIGLLMRVRSADRQSRTPWGPLFSDRQRALELARFRGDEFGDWPTQELPPVAD